MRLILKRDEDNGTSTSGRLYIEEEFLCYTLENSWLDNQVGISCVPKGLYGLHLKEYGRYWNIIQKPIPILLEVPNRSEILIHWGNYPDDTRGCILVGSGRGKNAVWNSLATWKEIHPYVVNATEILIEYTDENSIYSRL